MDPLFSTDSDRKFHEDHEYTICWGSTTIRGPSRWGGGGGSKKFLDLEKFSDFFF